MKCGVRVFFSVLVVAFIFLAITSVLTSNASALGVSLTTSPVSEVISAKPGTTTTTILHVTNNGPQPIPMTTKLFTFGAEGTTGKPAIYQRTAADTFLAWASFSPSSFVAQPNVPVSVTMTLTIPKDATLGYNIGVAFVPVVQTLLHSTGETLNGTNVILVLLDTSSANESRSIKINSFSATKKLYEYLPATFQVNVHNSGNIFTSPGGDIFISKSSSFLPGSIIDTIPINSAQGNVLPGTNRVFQAQWTDGFPLNVIKTINGSQVIKNNKPVYVVQWNFNHASKLRFGKYYAKLFLSYNNGVRQVPITALVSFWVVPWEILIILFIILVFFLFGVFQMIKAIVRKIRHPKNKDRSYKAKK